MNLILLRLDKLLKRRGIRIVDVSYVDTRENPADFWSRLGCHVHFTRSATAVGPAGEGQEKKRKESLRPAS